MARPALAVGLLVLVAVSGCLTGQPTAPEPVEDPSVDLPYDDRSGDGPPYDNPWRTDEIIVVVEDRAGMDRNVVPDVTKTIRYWEAEAGDGTAYDPTYRLVGEHPEPDIRIELVRTVEGCGVHEDSVALGCAPVLDGDSEVNGTSTVQVRSGHTANTTQAILKHEFGHTLGLGHSNDPGDVMAAHISARAPDDIIDAEDRTYPWGSEELQVAIWPPNEETAAERERIKNALDYYENGANGTVERPPSIGFTRQPRNAEVLVSLRKSISKCEKGGPDASCVTWSGPNIDDDEKPEYYTNAHIVVSAEGHNRSGWHVGYWLGRSLWTNGVPEQFSGSDRPPAKTWSPKSRNRR